jgi:TolB protein
MFLPVPAGKCFYLTSPSIEPADHKSTAAVWYKLLNCGFHLPMAIGPWLNAIKQGHTFGTNGPLLGFSLGGREIGDELQLPAGEHTVKFKAWMRSIVPVDHLQVICNGQLARELKLSGNRQTADAEGTLPVSRSGWCVLRAWSEHAEHPILDIYPYATTSPIYVKVAGSEVRSPEDAAYFVAWIDRLIAAAKANQDWNTEEEKHSVLEMLGRARTRYAKMEE